MADDANNDEFMKLAREAYHESTSFFDAGPRGEIEADMRQFQGLHPSGSKYDSPMYRGRSRFFRPRTRSVIRKHEAIAAAAFFGNSDVITLEAEDDTDPVQVASAAVMQEVMNYRLRKTIPWFQICIGGYQDSMVHGIVASYQGWAYNEVRGIDQPVIRLLPPENIRFSPGAHWDQVVQTSPYLIEMIPMLVYEVRARMKSVDEKTGEAKWRNLPEETIQKAARGYSDSTTILRNGNRSDSASQASNITEFSPVWVYRVFMRKGGDEYVYYTLGEHDLLTKPKLLEEVYFHGERPYVIGNCVIETHKLYPAGDARLLKDIQGELNANANQRMDNASFAMNKRYLVKRNAQVDLRALVQGNTPGSAILVNNVEDDVKALEFQDVTGSAYQEQDRLQLDADDLAGTFSQASVQGNRTLNETVGGMEILTADSNQMANYQLRIFAETWVKPVMRQLLKLEQHYESDEKMFLLAGKKAEVMLQGQAIDENLIMQELGVSVNVGLGATSPQAKLNNLFGILNGVAQAFADGTLERLGADKTTIIEEAFNKAGYDGSDRFFSTNDSEDPQVAQLKQMVAELEQKLAAKEDPELVAAKVRNLDAKTAVEEANRIKANVETTFGAMQGAEVIATTPGVAPVADQLLRVAGWQDPRPAGIDPGFAPGMQTPGTDPLAAAAMVAPPPDAAGLDRELPPGVDPNSNPGTPSGPATPASPFTGLNGGIETMRSDSEGADQ